MTRPCCTTHTGFPGSRLIRADFLPATLLTMTPPPSTRLQVGAFSILLGFLLCFFPQ